jgi:long-chain acyl-CoA synthetase
MIESGVRGANLAALLPAAASAAGERAALGADGAEISYRMLDTASARVAGLLRRRGLRPGDRVGLMLPTVPEFAIVYYGVLRAGGVVVPLSARLPWPDVAHYLGDAEAHLVFAWHAFAEPAEQGARGAGADCLFVTPAEFGRLLASVEPDRELAMRRPGDTAAILYSPATGGRSRGAELTHANLAGNAAAVRDIHALGPDDVVLAPVPLFRCWGQTCALNATLGAGARLELAAGFDAAEALQTIEDAGVTSVLGLPATFAALLEQRERSGADISTLRVCRSRGRMRPSLRREFEAAFGCAVLEGYGLTEASPLATSTRLDRPSKSGSAGPPLDGVEVAVLAGGEIGIRGPNVMKGYWRDPDATAERIDRAGFLRTRQRGWIDADGDLFVRDQLAQ